MNRYVPATLLSCVFFSTSLFASNPVPGFYGTIFGEVSHGPSSNLVNFQEDGLLFQGTANYSSIAGGAGFSLGYKYRHFRVEGEFLYNRISTGPLTVGTCTLQSPDIITPTGLCPQSSYDHFQQKALGYSGSSSAAFGLANILWDFYSDEGTSNVFPYLGLGLGKVQVKDANNFVNTITTYSHGHVSSNTGSAMQGILGIGYFMDDFAWVTMDYRYLTTKALPEFQNNRYTLNTLNFGVGFAFDKGGIDS